MTRIAFVLFAVLAWVPLVRADSLGERFARANRLLDAHRPEAAALELRELVALGVDDPDVYRNLGIAEAESMRYGHAMVAFERALSIRPDDDVARLGLENATTMLARRWTERAGSPVEIAEPGALESFGRSIAEPVAAWGTLIAAWVLSLALVAVRVVTRETHRIAFASLAAAAGLACCVLGVALLGRARWGGTIAPAIVVVEEAAARAAPDEHASTLATFHEGERLAIVERHGPFARVATNGRSRGWVRRIDLGTY